MSRHLNLCSVLSGLAVAFVVVVCESSPSHAASIPIVNPSFEINGGAPDNSNPVPATIAGWTGVGSFVFNPDNGDFAGTTDPGTALPGGGTYAAFVFSAVTTNFTQTLSTAVEPGGEYTLSYFHGDSGQFAWGDYTVSLTTTGGDTIFNTLVSNAGPGDGVFAAATPLTGTAGAGASGNLIISFTDSGTGLPFFDEIGLSIADAPAAPEPTSALLIVIGGALGIAGVRRRRVRK